jgi:drug/metabolite transporter (DMT)-like permease
VVALGAAQFGVFPLTFTISLDLTTASRGALVFALVPMFTLLFASLLRIEGLTRLKAAGAILALAGVSLSVGQRFGFEGGAAGLLGEMFMFITVLIGSGYNTLSRPYLRRYPARVLTVYFMWAGVALLAPFALTRIAASGLPAYEWWEWLLMVFTGTFGGSIGYFLYVWALQNGTPARVAMLVPLNPITATILGTALLAESLSVFFLVGLVCVVVGIVLANASAEPAPG